MPLSTTSLRVAGEVRAAMARLGCTQAVLAERINRDQHFVSRRLSGKVPFTIDELARIAEALNVPIEALLAQSAQSAPAVVAS